MRNQIMSFNIAVLFNNLKIEKPIKQRRTYEDTYHFQQGVESGMVKKDVAVVERMMADDYAYIAPNGKVLDRRAVLDIIESASYKLFIGELTEVTVRSLGRDLAAVISRWQGQGSFEGVSFIDDHGCTTVCALRGTEWQVVYEHCSPNNG